MYSHNPSLQIRTYRHKSRNDSQSKSDWNITEVPWKQTTGENVLNKFSEKGNLKWNK